MGDSLTLSESTVTDVVNFGGLISNHANSVLRVLNSKISNNRLDYGSIVNEGILNITSSVVNNNLSLQGGTVGGTVVNRSSAVITNSLISNNTGDTGGGIFSDGDLTLINSTLSGNVSFSDGSGVYHQTGDLIITNTTISGNRTTSGEGGGVAVVGGTATITHSTITNNAAWRGGGISGRNSNISLGHSIVAGNRLETQETESEGPNVYNSFASSSITSLGYNLIGNSTNNNSFVNGQDGDQVGTEAAPLDPGLRPLRNNGGPTPTHALAAISPAVNAGDPSFSPPPATDQRGEARVFNGRIDIGAFELTAVGASDDGDGVEAAIDGRYENGAFVDESTVASSSFTDQHLGGKTYGTLSGLVGDFAGSVKDINGAVGVVLSVQSGTSVQGGIASRSVVMCGGDYTILLDAGDTVEATCGSLLAKVISGNVDVTLSNGAVISAPQGATAFINKQNSGSFTVENRSSNQTITLTYQGERTSVAPGESASTAPPSDLYTVTFDGVPIGRVLSSVKLGNGIVSDSGVDTDSLYFYARRSDKGGNTAMVTGSRRELIISKDGRSQASYTRGGTILFSFAGFGSGKVTVKTLDVMGVTAAGGTVEVFDGRTRIKQVAVPKTGTSGRATLTIEAENVNILRVYLKGVGRVDNVVFEVAKP